MDFPWVADGMTEDERQAVNALREILREAPAVAETLLGFHWLADGVTEDESLTVLHLQNIVREDAAFTEALLGFPWLADGVTGNEWRAVRDLRYILREDAAMAETLLGYQWLADGVSWDDRRTLWGLARLLYAIDRRSLSALTEKSWFKDGLSREEFTLIGGLGAIANRAEADALAIIGMPFLETFEPADALAVTALDWLVYCKKCPVNEQPDEGVHERFRQVMAHPAIRDGINDEEAKIVATLNSMDRHRPGLEDILLDPDRVTLEERTIDLPLAGETQVTIIRTRPGAKRTMDRLVHVVQDRRRVHGISIPGQSCNLPVLVRRYYISLA